MRRIKGLVIQKVRYILSSESCEMSENTISKRQARRYTYFIFGRVRSRKKDHHIHNLSPSMFIFIFQCPLDCFTFSFTAPSLAFSSLLSGERLNVATWNFSSNSSAETNNLKAHQRFHIPLTDCLLICFS